MDYLYLIVAVVCATTSSVFSALFNRKNTGKGDFGSLYSLITCTSALVAWAVIYLIDFSFDPVVLLYSLGFGVFFAIVQTGIVNATKTGPVALTALASQLSLIGVTIWGFCFWEDKPTVFSILGILLVVLSLYFCLCGKKQDEKGVSLKWLIFAAMAFVGNMGCSVVQKSEQNAFDGAHGNQLMFFAMICACIVSSALYLKGKKERGKDEQTSMASLSFVFPMAAGLCNVLLNSCVIFLATSALPPSLIYPVIAVGGISLTSLCSVFIFKEKMSWRRWLGIIIGAIATVLLSLS